MTMRRRLLRGCLVVTPESASIADILVQGEWIAAVGHGLDAAGAEIVHCSGLTALPGGIDAHVHLREPGAEYKEDLTSGTRAALAGGFTTVLDMPNSPVATTSLAAFEAKARLVEAKACCNVGLFFGATPTNTEEAFRATDAVGLKVYMGSSTGDLLVADLADQLRICEQYPKDRVLAVHAEDEDAVRLFTGGERRPPICTELSVGRALALARHTGRRVHVCHASTAVELAAIGLARSQGVRVTVEVAPHHLYLSRDDEAKLGSLGVMNPPLRLRSDRDGLWAALPEVDMVASDHAPHTLAEKAGPKPPAGVPGLETTLPLLLDAVVEGRLALTRVAELIGSGPARAFGLPRKGRLAPGYQADITLVDLNRPTVLGEKLYTKCGWTPFQGLTSRGSIARVILRGQDAVVESEVLAGPGQGSLVTPRHR